MKEKKKLYCLNCGKPMRQVKDRISGKYTGYIWRCSKCMPKNMVVSVG